MRVTLCLKQQTVGAAQFAGPVHVKLSLLASHAASVMHEAPPRPPEQHTIGAAHAGPVPHTMEPVPGVPLPERIGPVGVGAPLPPPLLPLPLLAVPLLVLPVLLPLDRPVLLPLELPLVEPLPAGPLDVVLPPHAAASPMVNDAMSAF